jgi:hypothetical protein
VFKNNEKIKAELDQHFIIVHVSRETKEVNADLDELMGNPSEKGLPVLVVMDETGQRLVIQDTAALENGDHHDPGKVLMFLKAWNGEESGGK